MDCSITVFTPTYNRAAFLPTLYQSLLNQTDRDFEWLVVDDGSTDNTDTIIDGFKNDGHISVRYIKQPNMGKHAAHNNGIMKADSELFVCVDSDDRLLPEAISHTKEVWKACRGDKTICGIVSPRKLPDGKRFVNAPETGTLMQLYNRHIFDGDTMLVFQTDVLRENLFPQFKEEKFISECVVYMKIDQDYRLKYDNVFLYESEYHDDGITKNGVKHRIQSPAGTLYQFKATASLQTDMIKKIRAYGCYLAWKKLYKLEHSFEDLHVSFTTWLGGCLLYNHYKNYFTKERESL